MPETVEASSAVAAAHQHAGGTSSHRHLRWGVLVLGTITIFGGAFLLFSIQPLIGKIVLPRFGGSAAVWSVCLVFFQTTLLLGYALAYGLAALTPTRQIVLYALLWIAAALFVSIPVHDEWHLTWFTNPSGELLLKLMRYVALPCLMTSSVSIMVQVWSRAAGVKDPYAFYAVSNAGSLGALLAYPLLIEPRLSVTASTVDWTWAFRGLALCVAAFGLIVWLNRSRTVDHFWQEASPERRPSWPRVLAWIFLPAVCSGLLVTFTSRMTQDIAPIPLLWVIPLSLYLLTFILCFSHRAFYQRGVVLPLALIFVTAHVAVTYHASWTDLGFKKEVAGYAVSVSGVAVGIALMSTAFFLLALLLHGELYRLRPAPRYLSRFYLAIAMGGALGGAFVSLLAPRLFTVQLEYPILLGAALAVLLYLTLARGIQLLQHQNLNIIVTIGCITYTLWVTTVELFSPQMGSDAMEFTYYRNSYGPMRVEVSPEWKWFLHGSTLHGTEKNTEEGGETAISYYSPQSAAGMVHSLLLEDESRSSVRIGVIGLGAGTMAAYSAQGGVFASLGTPAKECTVTFYEIDPDVEKVARTHFRYLAKARGPVEVHLGDARTTLERQRPQQFDMIVVDAFSGDGIPVHLLTREALELYRRHLKPDGAVLFHVSNHYVDLEPVVANAAHALDLDAVSVSHDAETDGHDSSTYVVVSAGPSGLASEHWEDGGRSRVEELEPDPSARVWTDNYSNLASVLVRP